jgi:hypothetical protein
VEVKTKVADSVDNKITYLNTDLDLRSTHDISKLASFFEERGMKLLSVTATEDATWNATIEPDDHYDEPSKSIDTLLTVVESLPKPLQTDWFGCSIREFNIGYDCGDEPWAFNQAIPSDLLGRLAKASGTLRITLYPDRPSLSEANTDN